MVPSRAENSRWGQSFPWLIAAALVVAGSGFIALWLNTTASNTDRDTLNRGADAVQSAVEEQVRILELAGTGSASIISQRLGEIDVSALIGQIDITVLRSLTAMVVYPIGPDGIEPGEFFRLGLMDNPVFPIPVISATRAELESIRTAGEAFLSAPFTTTDIERHEYVVAMPIEVEDGLQLIGVVFRPDRMLASAVEAAGESQYAVDVIDARHGDMLIVSHGDPTSDLVTRRSPDGLRGALDLIVRPGQDFALAASPWITAIVIGTGLMIALLLVWMGKMAGARQNELAERLRLAHELNESKDRFLATVSHELRTPLTVVLGVAEEIGPKWDSFDDNDRQELIGMMTDQAAEAANIVEDLLVAARSDPSRLRLAMEDTHLQSHIEYALASLPAGERHRVSNSAGDHAIYADTTRLRQILRNLLENAIRYGGRDITIECQPVGSRLLIFVSDDGDSLASADIDRIFEPYEQSIEASAESPSGVGIGLYVSRLLARLMGGDLDCMRENGLTRFRLAVTMTEPHVVERKPELLSTS
ncbi:MAG: HAMP domain-containing histidine kinase [bacterium]|nr:HAMP domain-containing histidine kinase [bacterium]